VITGEFSVPVLDSEILERYTPRGLSINLNHVNGWTSESYRFGVDKWQIDSKHNFVCYYEQVMEWLDGRSGNIPS